LPPYHYPFAVVHRKGVFLKDYPHPILAREGWPFIAIAILFTLIVQYFVSFAWSIPLWIITLFIIQFFRDPARVIPNQENAILAPADGRIVAIDHTIDPYLKRNAIKVSVFMNVFNVHSNRSPVKGRVEKIWYHAGSFLNAALSKASLENERNAVHAKLDNGTDIVFVQIAGLVARRILCYVKEGDTLHKGQRYGFIRFGSRVDVYLPLEASVKVRLGDKISATETILAELPK
jgi:phosphatidylserine decarboxylase